MKIKDTRGRESITLTFCTFATVILLGKFALAGLVTSFGTVPDMSASEFGLAFAAVLAPWLHREWVEKKHGNEDTSRD